MAYGFYPAIGSFLSSFLSGRFIADVEGDHCSTFKPINSGIPQGSVPPPTLFLLFINVYTVLSTPVPMTPLCTTPRPLTDVQMIITTST